MLGPVDVKALEPEVPLGAVPLKVARGVVISALKAMAKDRRYEAWLLARQRVEVDQALCRKDELPTPGVVPLTDFLPFLAVD
jgi:hypothetical protein